MEANGFLTAGSWCLDRNLSVDSWPREDSVTTVRNVFLSGGGSGCNFAVDLRRLDPSIPVATQGVTGDDSAADFLFGVAAEHGIEHAGLRRLAGRRTSVTDAYQSAESGLRTHVLIPGVADDLAPEHFDFAGTRARILHLGLPGIHPAMDAPCGSDPSGWVSVLRRARAAGLETNMELVTIAPERLRAITLPCLPWLTTLVVNDFEIGAITGIATIRYGVTDREAVAAASRRALEIGAMDLVVVHFPGAALLARRDGGAVVAAGSVDVPANRIVGANGAGDAFAAGYFLGRYRNWDDARCLRMGHAAAATSLLGLGTYSAMEGAEACLARADLWGWRG